MPQVATDTRILRILVVDDHELFASGTIQLLKQNYSDADFITSKSAEDVLIKIRSLQPDLVILDLSIPETVLANAEIKTGINLLENLLKNPSSPPLNILVQSSYVKALIRLKREILTYEGGFAIADKSLSSEEILQRVTWSLNGLSHTRDLRGKEKDLEFLPEWIEVLEHAYGKGLQDRAIAETMNVSLRTVRNYWSKIADTLGIYSQGDDINLRVTVIRRAIEMGLID
jgi:DNA-binding NarL/FixJ family response regulator